MKAKAGPGAGLGARVPIYRSLQVQLLLVFVVSLVAAAVMTMGHAALTDIRRQPTEVDYYPFVFVMNERVRDIAVQVGGELATGQLQAVALQLQEFSRDEGFDFLVTSNSGTVLVKSRPDLEDVVDVTGLLQNQLSVNLVAGRVRQPFLHTAFTTVAVQGEPGFLILRGMTQGVPRYDEPVFTRIAVFLGTFLLVFFVLIRRRLRYLEELTGELLVISRGNLQHRVAERSRDELGVLARSINTMVTELEQRIEAERRAERTKSDLITGVSHDLRTPLTSIKGFLDIVRSGNYEDPEQLKRYVEIAHAKAEQLQEMVEELFEYTKLAGQDLVLHRQELSLNSFLAQMTEDYVPLFEPEGLALTRELPPGSVMASVDPDRFARVLDNLLMNARKYSRRPGTVAVTLRADAEGATILVQNPGPAISPEDLENLFTPFFRLDPARTQAAGGSGLGLAIARRIMELHGGRIWAESGDGLVRFCLWLPRAG